MNKKLSHVIIFRVITINSVGTVLIADVLFY